MLQDPAATELLNKNSEYKAHEIMRSLQPRYIAIIGDSAENDLDLVYIKELLHNARFELCTAKEYQEGLNEVALCYSCDIASLEWPVVLHIQTVRNKRLHYQKGIRKLPVISIKGSFVHDDYCIIATQCMVQYTFYFVGKMMITNHMEYLSHIILTLHDQGIIP